MREKKYRVLSLLFALLLVVRLCPVSVDSVLSGVYLISVDDDLMPMRQNTMPFWEEGELYVPYTAFQGIYSDSLGVIYTVTVDPDVVILYKMIDGKARVLTFELSTGLVQDAEKNTYPMNARVKNGAVFFPVGPVTEYFGLTYTYNLTDTVPLIRIKSEGVVLTDSRFITIAGSLMRQYYSRYEKEVGVPDEDGPNTPVAYTGQWIYPVFTVTDGESTAAISALLARREMQATFLMTPAQLEEEGDLVRMLVGMDQAIGILPDTENAEDVAHQLHRAGEAIWASARSTTRMVWLGEELAGAAETVKQLGYCPMNCVLDSGSRPMTSESRAESLYAKLGAMDSRSLTLFLGEDSKNTAALGSLLTKLEAGGCRVLAWRETL